MSALSAYLLRAVFGLGLGLSLGFIGFSDFEEVHRMFLFEDLRLFLTFLGGVTLAGLGFAFLRRARPLPPRPMGKGTVPGGVLFGVGWALCGACPGIVLVQLGEGKGFALIILAGLVVGNAAWGYLQQRRLSWDVSSCAE